MKSKLHSFIRGVASVLDYEIDPPMIVFGLAGIGMMACLAYPLLRNLDYAMSIVQ